MDDFAIRFRLGGDPMGLETAVVENPSTVNVRDCRYVPDPFVAIVAGNGKGRRVSIHVSPDLARQLHTQLRKLFPDDESPAAIAILRAQGKP